MASDRPNQTLADYVALAISPALIMALVGIIWWGAGRLARDCTNIDEETEVGGEGLLRATGLEKTAGEPAAAPEKKAEPSGALRIGWWERYQRFRDERKKKRVLGG